MEHKLVYVLHMLIVVLLHCLQTEFISYISRVIHLLFSNLVNCSSLSLGNASSLPPRLPFLSPILRMLRDAKVTRPVTYIMVCCSYRGYWTSKGRPTENGIALDAEATLSWIKKEEEQRVDTSACRKQINVVVWGQSIGAGVATTLAAKQDLFTKNVALKTLILETPFLGVRAMLETLYPQKFLPYRYLWPFLRTHLDSWTALAILKERSTELKIKPPNIVLLVAGRDELVPSSQSDILESRCASLGLSTRKEVIASAYHTEVLVRPGGRRAAVEAIQDSLKQHEVDEKVKL